MIPFALPPAETHLPLASLLRGLLPVRADFSEKLKMHLDAPGCVLAGNARSLLYLLFRALHGRARDGSVNEVLIPGYTCYSVAAAVVKAGLKVALYDIDPHTFQPDFEDVRRKINSATLAVIGQHLLGVKADIKELAEIAHQHGVCCIEDSAQYFKTGQFNTDQGMAADYVIFSFGRGKPLPLGGGGALIARNEDELFFLNQELKKNPPLSTNRLLPIAAQIFSWPRLYWILERLPLGLGRTIYDPEFMVSAMSLHHQRVGERALVELDHLNQHRVDLGKIYRAYFGGNSEGAYPHVRFPLLVGNQSEYSIIAKFGVRQVYPLALCDLPALGANLAQKREPLPGAREIAGQLVSLPTHLAVNAKIAEMICGKVAANFRDIRLVKLRGTTDIKWDQLAKKEKTNAV